MKNNDFSKIIILILLNSFVSTQEIKQIVSNPLPNHQFPEIQSIDSPPIHIQESDKNITLSTGLKWGEATEAQRDSLLIARNEELSEELRQRKKENEERKKKYDDDPFEIYLDLLVAILEIMAALGEIWG